MNKARLAREVWNNGYEHKYGRGTLSHHECYGLVGKFLDCIEEALIRGETVTLLGIGKLEPVVRRGRTFSSPQNGETLIRPDFNTIKFTLSARMRRRLNGRGG